MICVNFKWIFVFLIFCFDFFFLSLGCLQSSIQSNYKVFLELIFSIPQQKKNNDIDDDKTNKKVRIFFSKTISYSVHFAQHCFVLVFYHQFCCFLGKCEMYQKQKNTLNCDIGKKIEKLLTFFFLSQFVAINAKKTNLKKYLRKKV